MKQKGRIFIISAPSGCGKTTLCDKLLTSGVGLARSFSVTTRPRRGEEANGRDYYFAASAEFKKGIKEGKFLEWTSTFGWYYGTPRSFADGILEKGRDLLLSIDVKGAMNVKKMYPDSVLIFIMPPSMRELRARLEKRNADDKKEIEKRLRTARKEISFAGRYDYTVVNDNMKRAVDRLKAIVVAEKNKER